MYDQSNAQTLEFHRSMLVDDARMQAYLHAILKTVQPGDVVLDIGSGTGIMAHFACLAGARHVYAVEQGPVIELAKAISQRNGYGDRVTFLRNWSTHVELPKKSMSLSPKPWVMPVSKKESWAGSSMPGNDFFHTGVG